MKWFFSLIQGAGDAFIGAMAFYMAKFKMLPFEEIVRRAGEIARTSVLNPGTQSSYLSKKELSPSLFSELVQRGRGISTWTSMSLWGWVLLNK